jgi:aspartate kinase
MNDVCVEDPRAGQRCRATLMKFGGSSVQDAEAVARMVGIVRDRLARHPVLVVSALAGVTDQLSKAAHWASQGHLDGALRTLDELRRRHQAVAGGLVGGESLEGLCLALDQDFDALANLFRGISALGELSQRSQDNVLGFGECLSSRIVHSALVDAGLNAVLVDAHVCIVTDAAHTQATPLWAETDARLSSVIPPLLQEGKVPLLAGFIGATRDGVPTTLGRGGSDFTASIVGAALHADRIEIWTDVDGLMTADPTVCPDAQRIELLSFDEAAELAYFGAKVLHPASLLPAMRKGVPVHVLNSSNPSCEGTEIMANPESGIRVKAITARRGVAVVDVETKRWAAPEILRGICEIFERHQHRLDLLSSSRGSLTLLVTSTTGLAAVAEDLKGVADVRWENPKALVCLVGEQIRRKPEIASQVFGEMSDVDLRMICQGASERSISFLVDESQADEAVRRLHQLFFSKGRVTAPAPSVVARRPYSLCQAGESW